MHLVEIFLPVNSPTDKQLTTVRKELTERFGGVTAFTRAPAQGVWKEGGTEVHDDIIIVEVLTEVIDREWWTRYRQILEDRFGQKEILIRLSAVEKV